MTAREFNILVAFAVILTAFVNYQIGVDFPDEQPRLYAQLKGK